MAIDTSSRVEWCVEGATPMVVELASFVQLGMRTLTW